MVARSPEGQELPKFSDALQRLDNRASGAAIDGEIIAAAALLGAVLVVGLATATDYPLTVDEFNTDEVPRRGDAREGLISRLKGDFANKPFRTPVETRFAARVRSMQRC